MKLSEFKEKVKKSSDSKIVALMKKGPSQMPSIAWELIISEAKERKLLNTKSSEEQKVSKNEPKKVSPDLEVNTHNDLVDNKVNTDIASKNEQSSLIDPSNSDLHENVSVGAIPNEKESALKETFTQEQKSSLPYPPAKSGSSFGDDVIRWVATRLTLPVLVVAISGVASFLIRSIFSSEND